MMVSEEMLARSRRILEKYAPTLSERNNELTLSNAKDSNESDVGSTVNEQQQSNTMNVCMNREDENGPTMKISSSTLLHL